MRDRTMVNVSFRNETIARIDRLRSGTSGAPPSKRASWVAWATEQYISTLGEQAKPPAPKQRRVVARPFPAGVEGPGPVDMTAGATLASFNSEGARLKAARVAAGLSQVELAGAVSSESVSVSRQQVGRAERAPHLDGYHALRAWLLEREAAS